MKFDLVKQTPIVRSARVAAVEGIFDVPVAERSVLTWHVELPVEQREWNVGLIVGPSGSGKTTILRRAFGEPWSFEWPHDRSLLDAFPSGMPTADITDVLSHVGFSAPPSWLRPYDVLSNGEQFRATIARALVSTRDGNAAGDARDAPEPIVIDEFTSVVDRTVARIGSSAIAKHVRRRKRRFVAASCHYDIVDWLQPDWLYDTAAGSFTWRSVQSRPRVAIEVVPAHHSAWRLFRQHHYLTADLNTSARCFVALIDHQPAAFCAVLAFPHPRVKNARRESRLVCLPDFQGIGLGNALSELIGSCYTAAGLRYFSVVAHPALVRYRARSPKWRINRVGFVSAPGKTTTLLRNTASVHRRTAGCEYVGPLATPEQAKLIA